MTEPTATTAFWLTALAITLLGPVAGPNALMIAFAALGGAMWPLSNAGTATRLAGAWLLLRCTLTALILTAFVAGLVENFLSIRRVEILAPVAFVIGALGNGWHPVIDAIRGAVIGIISKIGTKP